MYPQLILLLSIIIELQELVYYVLQVQVWLYQCILTGNTAGISGVAAEAVEFLLNVYGEKEKAVASPSVSTLVLSYSGLGLLSLHSL